MNSIEQTLSSMEVAEMVEKEHKELLRDVRRYCEQLAESNIALGDFFTESTYTDKNNQERPCYQITKKGCEFIAHKLTGTKGTAFTARYINKFHEMEQELHGERRERREVNYGVRNVPINQGTWYERNKQKLVVICDCYGWTMKYLYHKILSAVGDIYDLKYAAQFYEYETEHKLRYATELFDVYTDLRRTAENYIDYLYGQVDDVDYNKAAYAHSPFPDWAHHTFEHMEIDDFEKNYFLEKNGRMLR